ncbi:annexin B9 [Procambarus clarkii]|uniref:annexin B9 n=1 Tax=Procambarus clarkii TaxID=6728 RepID=UPI003743152D
MYSRDLLSDLKSELSGHFKTVIVALLTPLPLFLAKELHYAMTGADTKEKTIVEILCTRDNASIKTIKEAYHEYYDKTLEESIEGNTSGHFRHFLLNICDCNRKETPCDSETAKKIAKQIAEALYEAGEDKPLTDEKFIYIMTRCSFYLLRFGFEEYNDTKDRNFGDFIEAECSEGIKYSLMTLYLIIMNRAEFFAKELHEAMREMGTKDKAIIHSPGGVPLRDRPGQYQARVPETLRQDSRFRTCG